MRLQLYQVDAFSSKIFSGNPAAICPLESWLDDSVLQAIASENNLSETAFFVPQTGGYHLRWFTPVHEVELCGHATLATAHILFTELGHSDSEVLFYTRSGELKVNQSNGMLTMDFPALRCEPCDPPEALINGLGKVPQEVFRGDDYLVVFDNEFDIKTLEPNHLFLSQLDARGIGVTARGMDVDFVSRFFAPKYGIDEDPVTGSFHCLLTPFWAERLQKSRLRARQVSRRGGELVCEWSRLNNRVLLSGQCATYMQAQINLCGII
ncbi:MAG: PhzF family phenazine biosynthesis protein [Gammaproteobacteria bacterium]|jgi:PhzF family phenazine biosynthesis protein